MCYYKINKKKPVYMVNKILTVVIFLISCWDTKPSIDIAAPEMHKLNATVVSQVIYRFVEPNILYIKS